MVRARYFNFNHLTGLRADPGRNRRSRRRATVKNASCGNALLAGHSVHGKRARCGIGRIVPGTVEAQLQTSSGGNAAVVTLVGNRNVGAVLDLVTVP